MSRLSMTLAAVGPVGGTFVGQLLSRSSSGYPSSRTVLLELGKPTTVDVDPGPVQLQVRLPSGDVLTKEATIADGADQALTLSIKSSRHEWLGWQKVLSPETDLSLRGDPFPVADAWITAVRIHHDGAHTDVPLDKGATIDGATCRIDQDGATFSLTIEGCRHQTRKYVELVLATGERQVVVPPTPWFDSGGRPLPVQILCDVVEGGTRPDVIVHDPAFSPVLAYYATGNFGAARELSGPVADRAQDAILAKFRNPVAGAAGALVLRRLDPKRVQESWLRNLAGISSLSDGAILYASHLMSTRQGRSDLGPIRELVLEARKRGAPIFAECIRLLNDVATRLTTVDQSPELNEAFMWTRHLMLAARADTIITWLAADDRSLARIVPDVIAPPTK